jgi:branched-chain amino acid transport system permease protein
MPTIPGYLVTVVLMFVMGVLLERVAHAPLRRRSHMVVVIATLGAGLAIQNAVQVWQGSDPKNLPSPLGTGVWRVAGAAIPYQNLLVIGVTVVAVVALMVVFNKTQFGRQLRAVAVDTETASLQGIPVRRFAMVTFGLGGLLAGLAGLLVGPISSLSIGMGFSAMVTAFAAAVIGGFGRLSGVVAGALALGLAQQLGAGYIAYQFAEVYPFALMILVIALRPEGLFGNEARARL